MKKTKNTKSAVIIRRFSGSRGSLSFFVAAVVLPLLFFLFSISLDVSAYFTVSEKAQRIADDAALYAYKFLPSRTDAELAARMFVNQQAAQNGVNAADAQINATNDTVAVLINSNAEIMFARWFGLDAGIPFSVYAESRSTPLDVYLAIDSSSYLAPDPLLGPAWGEAQSWPSASFFANERIVSRYDEASGQSVQLDPRLVTQQCFNPAFLNVKRAAIMVYDFLSSFRLNSVGVGFYPGYAALDLDSVRSVRSGGLDNVSNNGEGEARFDEFAGNLFSSNALCAAAAERENNHFAYRFPEKNQRMGDAPEGIELRPANMIIPGQNILNPEYIPFMQAREVIWSRAVNSTRATNFENVFDLIFSELLGARSDLPRGGLIDRSPKVAVIVSGDLPRSGLNRFPQNEFRSRFLESYQRLVEQVNATGANFKIYYLVFQHPGVVDPAWQSNLAELDEFFSSLNFGTEENGSVSFKLLSSDSPEQLVDRVTSALVLQKRTVMLAR